MRDNRWNTTALLLLRISQLVLGATILGICAYFAPNYDDWLIPFDIVLSAFTLVWVAVVLGLFFASRLLPLIVTMVDLVLAVFYIVSIAITADSYSRAIGNSCAFLLSQPNMDEAAFRDCGELEAGFRVLITQTLTFLGAIIWDGVVLHRNRNGKPRDVQDAAKNAMHGADAGSGQMVRIGGTYRMPEPMVDPENGGHGENGNHGARVPLSQHQLRGFPIYPTRIATLFDPRMQQHLPPAMPQQGVMAQFHQHQNHHQQQQIYQFDQVQQHQQQYQHQWRSQHQRQRYQENRGPPPQELDGSY
ncbi:unnamed protein product [Tuber melanosporum]|uniref:(Perigord truffle) hypothetical protein n=1 Tax=Tuber melanosporum (strain Mel28) TaxID=656061 RepID=D5G7L5_TUBMM|nr:uncharacterized protein GSTUM_00004610001 [Tuber melanosporum]CAZ80508.1 unnamed protein product [Tuber melanosporum]